MRGCLFTLLLGGVVIGLFVVIGLPQVAAGVLTTAVAAAGLQADDTTVTVTSDPPTDLVGLHADRVRIRATDASFRGLEIGALDLELREVGILDRTVEQVAGRLTDVTVSNVGGRKVTLDAITIAGGGDEVTATTQIAGAQAEALLADAIEQRLGSRPASVSLGTPNTISVDIGVPIDGVLDISPGGDLVAIFGDTPTGSVDITLLHAGEDLPIRLTGLVVTPGGDLRLTGDLSIGILGQLPQRGRPATAVHEGLVPAAL